MRNLMLGAAIVGLSASILGGCLGGDESVPAADEASEAQAALGVAPRGDLFALSVERPTLAPARATFGAAADKAEDEGIVTAVHANFDPAAFRESAGFRAKLATLGVK
jgi:hypothetical protein